MAARKLQEIESKLQEALRTLKEKNKSAHSKRSVKRPNVSWRHYSYDGIGRRISKSKYTRRPPKTNRSRTLGTGTYSAITIQQVLQSCLFFN